jgi:hypothetical protein
VTKHQLDSIKRQIEVDYFDFKTMTLAKKKEEIFNDCGKIYFYNEMFDYLTDVELTEEQYLLLKGSSGDYSHIIGKLYQYYLKFENVSVESYEEIKNFLETVCEYKRWQKAN